METTQLVGLESYEQNEGQNSGLMLKMWSKCYELLRLKGRTETRFGWFERKLMDGSEKRKKLSVDQVFRRWSKSLLSHSIYYKLLNPQNLQLTRLWIWPEQWLCSDLISTNTKSPKKENIKSKNFQKASKGKSRCSKPVQQKSHQCHQRTLMKNSLVSPFKNKIQNEPHRLNLQVTHNQVSLNWRNQNETKSYQQKNSKSIPPKHCPQLQIQASKAQNQSWVLKKLFCRGRRNPNHLELQKSKFWIERR